MEVANTGAGSFSSQINLDSYRHSTSGYIPGTRSLQRFLELFSLSQVRMASEQFAQKPADFDYTPVN